MNSQHGYDHWGKLSEGKRPVCKDGEWFYVDEAENRLSNGTVWESAGWFHNGYAVVEDARGEYHINHSFQPLYGKRWAYASPFVGEPLRALVRHPETGEEFHILVDGNRAPAAPPPPWQQ